MDTVASIMTTGVHRVRSSEVIGPVRDLMIEERIGCVPVVDDDGTLRGIVTSSDLVEEWPPQMGVQTVMSTEVLTVPPHRSVADAAREMAMRHVHHLVVVDHGAVVGVVSSFDLLMVLAGRLEEATPAETGASRPSHGFRARPGDHIIVRGGHIGDRDRRAYIEEVRGVDGGPPYVVRWLGGGDERQHLYFPGSDASIEPRDT